jgi:glycosyltransferase involved in cell wall biosynthesis
LNLQSLHYNSKASGKAIQEFPPVVSVIIPTYNRGHCLSESIDSVLSQEYRQIELIVVDDGSTDETCELVAKYPDLVYHRLEKNSGVSHARNLGVELARGELICFLDSDDLWQKNKLKIQVDWMQAHPDCKICYSDEIWIRNGVRVNPMKKHRKYSGDIYQQCLALCIVSPSSVMLRSSLLQEVGGFDETFPVCEDYDLWLRIAHRYPFQFIDEKLIVKRGGHQDQLSRKLWGMDRYRVYAMEKRLEDSAMDKKYHPATAQALLEKCDILIKGFNKRGKIKESRYFQSLIEKYSSMAENKGN